MERKPSGRRKSALAKEQTSRQETQSRLAPESERRMPYASPSKRQTPHRPWMKILGSSLFVCFLIVLAYLKQCTEDDPLQSLLPFSSSRTHHGESQQTSLLHSSDASRPRIELHPEDHVYRGPLTQHLDWLITWDNLRPDGVQKRVYLINGLFPGPTIEARSGDTLVISVKNALEDESISIHWHGLHVHYSMDGAAGITQCPIPPGGTFVYNFTIPSDQSGTFWYHSHSGISRADGLYGGFIVHAPASKSTVRGLMTRESSVDLDRYGYDKELLLLIGDWYHRSAQQVLAWYMRAGSFGNEPVPDSLLLNGVGHFDCSMAVPARPLDCIAVHVNSSYLDLDRKTAYRVRVVNTGSLAGFTLAFDHEQLEVIQLDSVEVEPQHQQGINSAGVLSPGQRMDLIVRSPPEIDDNQSSSVTVKLDQGCFKYPNPALTPDQSFPINPITVNNNHKSSFPDTTEKNRPDPYTHNDSNHIDIEKIPSTSTILSTLPETAQQTHVVYTKIQKLAKNHNVPFAFFNQTSWRPQQNPPIPLTGLPRQKWDGNQLSVSTGPDPIWVDLVVNNLDEGAHPFHLHGHHFYILTIQQASIGWGSYNPFVDPYPPGLGPSSSGSSNSNDPTTTTDKEFPYDLTKAVLRDTVQIPSRGYAVLRFKADNPGVWLFHCHIVWHLASGMAMLVDVMGDGDGGGLGIHDPLMALALGEGGCPVSSS